MLPQLITLFIFSLKTSLVLGACPAKPDFVASATSVGVPPKGGNCPVNTICISDGGVDKCFQCKDTNSKCASMKDQGYCANLEIDFEIRSTNCAKTCEFCNFQGEYFQTDSQDSTLQLEGQCPPGYIKGAFDLCLRLASDAPSRK